MTTINGSTAEDGIARLLENYHDILNENIIKEREAAEGLKIDNAYFAGAEKQASTVKRLANNLNGGAPEIAEDIRRSLLGRLCDAFSLCPRSQVARILISDAFACINKSQLDVLAQSVKPKIILHLSCMNRIENAKKSVDSFAPFDQGELHIIVVGREEVNSDMEIHFSDGVLTLPVLDSYEGLARKMAYACFVVNTVAPLSIIAKFDDDIRLVDRSAFNRLLGQIDSNHGSYFGFPISISHHSEFWHGWHQGKCNNKRYEDVGICFPTPMRFANGGAGYFLKAPAVRAMSYANLAYKDILDAPAGWAEDVITGLILEKEMISLVPIEDINNTGYTSQESQRHLLENECWGEFTERLRILGRYSNN